MFNVAHVVVEAEVFLLEPREAYAADVVETEVCGDLEEYVDGGLCRVEGEGGLLVEDGG